MRPEIVAVTFFKHRTCLAAEATASPVGDGVGTPSLNSSSVYITIFIEQTFHSRLSRCWDTRYTWSPWRLHGSKH